ncbi:MAG: LysR family transcriptional regulator [Rhizobiaceae bacterium]|nr:LysR family transcriptional regulator [Rhizobiaceae bacterium]
MAKSASFIELRHLRYFVAAAEHGSFRKTGAALGISQSAISRSIRHLEDRLGVSLFHRHTSGVSLTYAGERFLRRTRQGLRAIDEGERSLAVIGRGEEGVLRIGIFSSLASGFLSDLLGTYEKTHNKVRLDFIDGSPADHIAAIRQLQLDVAFITGTSAWSDCETQHLWSERVFVVLPDHHPLTVKSEVGWADLAGEVFIVSDIAPGPEIHDYLVQRLADLGHHPQIEPQKVGRDNLLTLVALGRGLTVTSEATTAARIPGVVYRSIVGEVLPFSAVWSSKNDNPAFRKLLSLARSMARSNKRKAYGHMSTDGADPISSLQNFSSSS